MQLSIITLGDVHTEHLAPLSERFDRLEQLVLDINPRDALSRHRPEFHRALDASSADWILVVREREMVDDALAAEIGASASEAKAWGFRMRVVPFYAGKPLHLHDKSGGEVRLFHKRHYLRFSNRGEWEEVAVQGTIIRMESALRMLTFDSVEQHRTYLEKTAARRSALKRLLVFVRDAAGTATLDRNTLRYIWTEAGFAKP